MHFDFSNDTQRKLALLEENLKVLQVNVQQKPDKLEKDAYERLADLEVKMARLWGLLTEELPSGKTKLSKFGRKFGGASTSMLGNLQR